ERIETEYAGTPLYPVLLTSLMEAADRVDSTTGQQMAYLKTWAPRAYNDLELRVPELLDGSGWTWRADANELAGCLARHGGVNLGGTGCGGGAQVGAGLGAAREDSLPEFDLVYLDPPYNQHRYFTNYHIWETLVRWDAPEAYGVACKRADARDPDTHSPYNRRREMPQALADLVATVPCQTLVLSYNNEAWVDFEELFALVAARFEDATALAFDSKRYVGAQIGIYSPTGQRVGKISHLRNLEYVFVGGSREVVSAVRDDFASLGTTVHV
ncbi:DNA adenine methylase, partial [Mobiluncus mulieris]